MPSVEVQAAALSGMLAAATGNEPRTEDTPAGIRIEAELPEQIGPATRTAILTALSIAPEYGHTHSSGTETVWAFIPREEP
jgi:hypothetical protein